MKHSKTLFFTSVVLAGSPGLSAGLSAGVFLSGDVVAGTGSLTISPDLSFTVGISGDAVALVFKGWGTPIDFATDGAGLSAPINLSVDGGEAVAMPGGPAILYDNFILTSEDVEPNDAFINFDTSIAVTAGQTLTFYGGTWGLTALGGSPFGPGDGWNPAVSGAYGGEVFLVSGSGTSMTNAISVSVPEPSSLGIFFGASAFAWIVSRRRRS